MDEITASQEQARVVIWLDKRYSTRELMLEAACKALQREMLRVNPKNEARPWDHLF